jgi:UDP-N-acetylmuramate dehydrogenase
MRVGGNADYFAVAHSMDDLIKLVRWARSVDRPYLILGGGSNVLISDAGVRGLVIQNRARAVRIDEPPCCDYPQDERPFLFAESGAALAGAARISINAGLTGFEWAVSVPGTVGGAVINNAGAHGGEVQDNLWDVLLLDGQGDLQSYGLDQLAYDYRHSSLKRPSPLRAGFGPALLCANFRLERGDPATIRARADQFLSQRRRTQPVEPSLGSTFANPPGDFAGRLIEAAGLKGHQIGGIQISPVHANFLINPGGVGSATAQDVARLMGLMQKRVAETFGIHLTPEIQLVGEWEDIL